MSLTLAQRGYRMPAEWEPHKATWLAWPHKEASWPGKFEPVPAIWAQMVRAIVEGEDVHINVADGKMEAAARQVLKEGKADASNVYFHHFPTNDAWARDHGPIFVKSLTDNSLVITKWGYNAWGDKYPPYDLDNEIPFKVGDYLKLPVEQGGMILEGGSIDVNGRGLLLTSEQCLLNKNRNPHMTREQIEQKLRENLGVRRVLWLGEGIEGDDTDGHIDDITRFVSENTIVTMVEEDTEDPNHGFLADNLARLREMKTEAGGEFDIITMQMPNFIEFEGQRMPASYANFYISNAAVVVPIYEDAKKNDAALGTLKDIFPGRRIVGIDSRDLIWGLGAFHCVTQQQPL